jgi:hypothetical protein
MMEEDYISFETAKLLKEKGFDASVTHYYFTQITHVGFKDYPTGVLYTDSDPQHQNNYKNKVAAPTQALVMKWLREVHSLHIWIGHAAGNVLSWYYEIHGISDGKVKHIGGIQCGSYEVACESAIKFCLENLIK